jgi:hypothetical protein
MDEELIDYFFGIAQKEGFKKTREDFVKYVQTDDELFDYLYGKAQKEGYKKDKNHFSGLVGRGANQPVQEPAKTETVTETVTEESPMAAKEPISMPTKFSAREVSETVEPSKVDLTDKEKADRLIDVTEAKKKAMAEDMSSKLMPVTENTKIKEVVEEKKRAEGPTDIKVKEVVKEEPKLKAKDIKKISNIPLDAIKSEFIKLYQKEYSPEIPDKVPSLKTDIKKEYNNLSIEPYEYEEGTYAQEAWDVMKEVFPESVQNSMDWYKSWYEKRKELPEFKDIASKRLNAVVNNLIPIILEAFPDYISKGREGSLATTYREKVSPRNKPYENKIFVNNAVNKEKKDDPNNYNKEFTDEEKAKDYAKSEVLHETEHWLENNFPQPGTDRDAIKNKYTNQVYDKILNEILPKEYSLPDRKDDIYYSYNFNDFDGLPSGIHEYVSKPTELRARLEVWRERNNISPTKKYSEEEIKKIIENNIKDFKSEEYKDNGKLKKQGNKNIMELYKVIRKNPKVLQQMNEKFVNNDTKENKKNEFEINPFAIDKNKIG